MQTTGIFFRFTRLSEYVHVLLLVFPLVYLISPSDLFSYTTVIVFAANLCLTAFGYIYNDLEDADDDYHDLDKRERNPISSGEITRRQSFFINAVLVFAGLYLFNLINPLVFLLGVAFAFVGIVYSWKTLRLKSKPILDLVSHVLFLGVLQFLTTYAAFRPVDMLVVPFLMIIVPISMMNEILHELKDYEVDKATQIRNTVQSFEKPQIKRLLYALLIVMIAGFAIIIFTLPPQNRIINAPVSLALGSVAVYRMNLRTMNVAVVN